jgi:hypothetical protein
VTREVDNRGDRKQVPDEEEGEHCQQVGQVLGRLGADHVPTDPVPHESDHTLHRNSELGGDQALLAEAEVEEPEHDECGEEHEDLRPGHLEAPDGEDGGELEELGHVGRGANHLIGYITFGGEDHLRQLGSLSVFLVIATASHASITM